MMNRLVALDFARFLAIVGMMAAHLLVPLAPLARSGASVVSSVDAAAAPFASMVAPSNAATLFAVLGGTSIVFASRGLLRAGSGGRAVLRVMVRGAVVAVIGLLLGFAPGSIVVVLVPYGAAMMLAAPLVLAPRWIVCSVAAVLVAGSGVLNSVVRSELVVANELGSATFLDLSTPSVFARGVLLTGTYPAVTWLAYISVGILLGRALVGGVNRRALLLLAAVSAFVVALVRVVSALYAAPAAVASGVPAKMLDIPSFGSPVGSDWWWLLLPTAHSGSPADMLSSAGIAVGVIAVLAAAFPATAGVPRAFAPIRAAGAAPLTLYVSHVLLAGWAIAAVTMPGATITSGIPWWAYGCWALLAHVAFALIVGVILSATARRGPLEALVSGIVRRVVPAPGAVVSADTPRALASTAHDRS